MIGWAIRSTSALNLDLPPIFWKKILNVEPDEFDLKTIDTFSWQVIQDLKRYLPLTRQMKGSKSEETVSSIEKLEESKVQFTESLKEDSLSLLQEEFSSNVDEKFITVLTDGTEAELCLNGKSMQVTIENLDDYIDLLIEKRLSEFDLQMKSIKEGINLIIPDNILFFMTWQEIDMRATGAKTIDLDTLKSITTYDVRM